MTYHIGPLARRRRCGGRRRVRRVRAGSEATHRARLAGTDGSLAGRRPSTHEAAPSCTGRTDYRTKRVGWGLVPGVVVGGGVVEFVEADCVAPAGDGAGGLVGLTGLVPGIFEGCVGGHGRQDPRCWLRVG